MSDATGYLIAFMIFLHALVTYYALWCLSQNLRRDKR